MPATTMARAAFGLALLGLLCSTAATAQNPAHTHIRHVADEFRGTPDGQGLLPAALAEAEIAAQHAGLAARDPSNLVGMQRHIGHVLNAIDPTEVENGPGLGYGVKQAAAGAIRHIELAAGSEGASRNVMTHANHIATAVGNVVQRVEAIVVLAKQIQEATSASDAAALLEELTALSGALVPGIDANGDGRVGWQEGEGGLQQATQHMTLMKNGEGLSD